MKALVLTAPETLSVQDIPVRKPNEKEVLIEVKACGVCGTDLHMFHGDKGAFENSYPLVMGHEFSGVVAEIGSGVTKFRVGDHVAVDPNIYCGQCAPCLRGDVHYCEHMTGIGTTTYGGFEEYCTVPERAVYRVPEELPFEVAAMMEPVSCAMHGIDRSSIRPGDMAAIIGYGPIGEIMFQLAQCAGAAQIAIIEPQEAKREKAIKYGAALAIDPMTEDVKAVLQKAGIEPTTVIECVGRKNTMEMALDIAANQATVMLFGLTPPETKLEVYAYEQLFKKEICVTGSYINPLVAERVIRLLASGKIDMGRVITDVIPLEDSVKVFTDNSYRSHGKIVIVP
ncbi:MAG: zinc-dependent alcohol dehydrogenase family protein [Lachnospiraceae bacterium]|nr:zinc-dependent alcohol dehydrogenase family protein [Lachnospiraceae bacterium]